MAFGVDVSNLNGQYLAIAMKVLDLQCVHEHVFEGWFASEADFLAQRERGFVQCPMCGNSSISKMLSAPRLNLCSNRELGTKSTDASIAVLPDNITGDMTAAWLALARQVVANTVDVGPRFAEEARKMHYGEAQERGIRGNATAHEARSLQEEGIEVLAFMLPEVLKEPLQ